jgi:hypothetical protein
MEEGDNPSKNESVFFQLERAVKNIDVDLFCTFSVGH